mmetsp:Transcript_8487/g.26631  ORF Transcript_8487/g.26631 Transcript_8487/m.26631 type:complete len:526 (+) Transcript_8487:30-1607(+)|eukprot:CAMPEP_0196780900 /NCGR_PEP_ID=MMETSP1104-20130614/8766_1 /TAXON_ID=33652 /ORGANISM="Cafeteria sp., Strain Caron Lab Isolate" /LENGTH=525 /DNA_ID=CAMNT_0042151117 /DNA_START=30 /DNA_END=1607 /DNA_ORIENTATION=+
MDEDSDYEYQSGEEYEEYEYEDGDEVMVEPEEAKAVTPQLKRQASYAVWDMATLKLRMESLVREVSELLAVPFDDAQLLLHALDWNKRRLQELWFDGREAKIRDDSGIHGDGPAAEGDETFMCPTCMDDTPKSGGFALSCSHWFCRDCWSGYVQVAATDGKPVTELRCQMNKCFERVRKSDILGFLSSDELKERVEEFWTRSFVEKSKELRWCPAPGCGNAVESANIGDLNVEVQCTCGFVFCFGCGEPAHRPATCEVVHQWNMKNSAESENVTWIMANTKQCPKCRKPIEKNQGCNHMTCRTGAGGCGHEFCWLCLGKWSEHGSATGGYYRCNKYEEDKKAGRVSNDEKKRDAARTELNRYMHYFERFINHERAAKHMVATQRKIVSKMTMLQDSGMYKIAEVLFLKDAGEEVLQCRRVLKWTYPLSYYMPPGKEKTLFEFLQENLEKNLEHLHELVERPLDPYFSEDAHHSFFLFRTEVTNYTNVTRKFRQNLMEGVERGLTSAVDLRAEGASAAAAAEPEGK